MTRSLHPGSEEIPGWILPAKDPRKIPLREKAWVNAIENYRCESKTLEIRRTAHK